MRELAWKQADHILNAWRPVGLTLIFQYILIVNLLWTCRRPFNKPLSWQTGRFAGKILFMMSEKFSNIHTQQNFSANKFIHPLREKKKLFGSHLKWVNSDFRVLIKKKTHFFDHLSLENEKSVISGTSGNVKKIKFI